MLNDLHTPWTEDALLALKKDWILQGGEVLCAPPDMSVTIRNSMASCRFTYVSYEIVGLAASR